MVLRIREDEYCLSQYRSETFFVVGSYGPGGNLGKCYEFTKFGSFWTFVGQVVNEGTDIKDGQFDMQTGAGGFGIFNGCTRDSEMPTTKSGSLPMFNEDASAFGEEFGGIQSVEECSMAPDFPATGSPPPGEPTVKELCRRSYDWGARNGDITSIRRIKCPLELVSVTGLRLNSDDSDFDPEIRFSGTTTTTMDCCLPASGYPRTEANTPRFDSDPQYPFVRGCMRDGYTRF